MGSSSIISEWNAFRSGPGRIVQVEKTGFCSASDCLGFVRSRNCSKQWKADLFTIEGSCQASNWSDDENSKLPGSEPCCGTRSSHQESKRKESLRWEETGRVFSVEGTWTMFKRRLMWLQSWQTRTRRLVRWSETKRAIVCSRTKFEGKEWRWRKATDMKTLTKEVRFCAYTQKLQKKKRHVKVGIFPCVKTTTLRMGASLVKHAVSDMLRQRKSPAEGQRNVVQKDQVHYWRSLHNWVVYLKNSCPRKYSTWTRKIGSKHAVKLSRGTWHQIKNSGKKGFIARKYPKVCASWAKSLRAKIRGKITRGELKNWDKATCYIPFGRRPLRKDHRRENS